MNSINKLLFLENFFQFDNPKPILTRFTEEQLKNNDMKISLQIATCSFLRMQSDPKTSIVSFSCKNYGKNCFQIFASKVQGCYQISTDYRKQRHHRNCQLHDQFFQYLKIYNLMKLKKNLIESIMVQHNLLTCSPSQILSQLSHQGCYFFQKNINYNPDMRRKLRKRFDNIINIDIKKITKGGREQSNDHQPQILKEKKYQNKLQNNQQQNSDSDESQFTGQKKHKNNKSKLLKKKQKLTNKIKQKRTSISKDNKQNFCQGKYKDQGKCTIQKIDDQIYINPASECELKEIKQLNQQFNGYGDIFSWSSEEENYQPVYQQTINDKIRENVFLSLRSSLLKRPIESQSLLNFAQQIIGPQNGLQNESIEQMLLIN